MGYARKQDESQWGTGRTSKNGAKISLLLSGDDGMVQTALISPLLASIAIAYPDATELMLDQAMSVTAMTMLPAMLCSSVLARYFNKKKLIMFGTLLFMLAGLSAMFAPNMVILVLTRAILGIGAGIAFPLVPSSIAYLFNEHEKNQMLGWMNACGSLLSFTLSMAAGWVALVNWKLAFLFYLIFVPILVLQAIFLPDFKPEKKEAIDRGLRKEPLNWKMWLVGIGMLLFMVLAMVATFKLSLFVELNGLGTSADSGTGVSCMTCASFLISLFFATYFEKLTRFAPVVSLCFAGAAFITLSVSESIPAVFAGMVLLGFCMGTINPFFMSTMSRVAPDTRKTLGMTMMCIFQLGGQIFTPYYMMLVGSLGFSSERSLFGFTAGLFIVAAVVVAVFALYATAKERRRLTPLYRNAAYLLRCLFEVFRRGSMSSIAKALNMKEAWGVYALYVMVAGAGAVTPALAAFGAAFPDANPVTISLIQSLPSLTTIIGTLFIGAVAGKKIPFKVAGIIALVVYFVFGCLPAVWNDSLTSILIARALVGFGMGMVSPLGAAIFLRLVDNKQERSKYLGRGGAMQQAGCVVLTLLGGFLCAIDWRLTFWAYGLALVALLIFVICFKEPPSLAEEAAAKGTSEEKSRIPGTAWFFIVIFLLAQVVCSPTMMNFSMLMATNIPGEDPTTVAGIAGTLLSVFVLAGVVSSVLMDKLIGLFGKYTGAVALAITLIGNIIIANANSVALFTIGILVFGFGWCLVIPVINLECGNVTNKAGLAMVASLVMVAMNLGNFVASYYMGAVFSVVGNNPSMCLIVDSAAFAILAIAWAVFNMRNKAWMKDSSSEN